MSHMTLPALLRESTQGKKERTLRRLVATLSTLQTSIRRSSAISIISTTASSSSIAEREARLLSEMPVEAKAEAGAKIEK